MGDGAGLLPGRDQLVDRARRLREGLRDCRLCAVNCGVDRLAGERGACGLTGDSYCFKHHISFAEEVELLPAYMVYLGACNLRCRFCIQGPDCFDPDGGELIEPVSFAQLLADQVQRGAKTVVLVGGEPSLHAHTILEIAAHAPFPLPLVLKTNMFMSKWVVDALAGVIQLYVADFKFGSDSCAQRLAGANDYFYEVTDNLRRASNHTPLLIRHLLMPGHVDCCFRPVARWVAEHLPGAGFHLMTGYVPAWRAREDTRLGRTVNPDELLAARAYLRELNLPERRETDVFDKGTIVTS